tara:strand:+ start:94 stop:264 length:171 start_codon:yes stop_codon:yes gene_type:complete
MKDFDSCIHPLSLDHGTSVYPPNTLPKVDLTNVIVGATASHFAWNYRASNPSLEPL